MRRKLAGIFLVEDIYGTAWNDQFVDEKGRPVGGMLALNVSALRAQTANAWATWKENTPFASDARFQLTAQIERDADNNRKNAIQYILLHEFGHTFAIGNNVHPSWNAAPRNVRSTERFAYFRLSWAIAKDENRYVTLFDNTVFPTRRQVVYYAKPMLTAEQAIEVYDSLEKTNLPTLYAATHPADDFAEAFATYVHTVLMKKPFQITMSKNGAVVKTYSACWEQQRCAEKRILLEALLRREYERASAARAN